MDNISIKFDRFFAGYSSDMKILMDYLKEKNNHTQPELANTHGTHQNSSSGGDKKSLKSNTSYTSQLKLLLTNDEAGMDKAYEHEKKILKQIKIRGLPIKNTRGLSSENSKDLKSYYIETSPDNEFDFIKYRDNETDSDNESEYGGGYDKLSVMRRSNSSFKPQDSIQKRFKKHTKAKYKVSMRKYLLDSIQKQKIGGQAAAAHRHRSESDISFRSSTSSQLQHKSQHAAMILKRKMYSSKLNITFDNIELNHNRKRLTKTNLLDMLSKSEILYLKKTDLSVRLDNDFAKLLRRKKSEKQKLKYPKIFISKPDDISNINDTCKI